MQRQRYSVVLNAPTGVFIYDNLKQRYFCEYIGDPPGSEEGFSTAARLARIHADRMNKLLYAKDD